MNWLFYLASVGALEAYEANLTYDIELYIDDDTFCWSGFTWDESPQGFVFWMEHARDFKRMVKNDH